MRTPISSRRLVIIDQFDKPQLAAVAVIGRELDGGRHAWRYVAEEPQTYAGREIVPDDLKRAFPVEAFGVRLFVEDVDGVAHLGAEAFGPSEVDYPRGPFRDWLARNHPDRIRRQWENHANDRVKINPNLAEALKRMAVTEERQVA